MSQNEINRIFEKTGQSRYRYFIKTVCEEEEVWGLADEEGWLMLEEDVEGDNDVFLVFPAPEFAAEFQKKHGYEDFQVEALDLYEFVDWLGEMAENGTQVAVFPNLEMECAILHPNRLKEDFQAEFDKEHGET
jgi:Protein of unknown function (DUF2750)